MSLGEAINGQELRRSIRRSKNRRAKALRQQSSSRRQLILEPLEQRSLLTASSASFAVPPNDPLFSEQWNLQNTGQVGGTAGQDINVAPVWQQGDTGQGVTVGIVDTGVDPNHPDLAANYSSALSYDYLENQPNPTPPLPLPQEADHGTEVAGIIAGVGNNGIGVTGVAPSAQFAALRAIGTAGGQLAPGTDFQISNALEAHQQQIDIYNNSWGPSDLVPGPNGFLIDVPTLLPAGPLTQQAIQQGVTKGRGGLGDVYVFAAGNYGYSYGNNNVNYDGDANSPYVIAVGGVNQQGTATQYAQPGAALLVSAPTGNDYQGLSDEFGLPTTDIVDGPVVNGQPTLTDTYVSDDTNGFNGTSAATPQVSGVIALMLQANPSLSYRDVMMILAETARQNDPTDPGWMTNSMSVTSDGAILPTADVASTTLPAGVTVSPLHFNNAFGFGVVDAAAAVAMAKTWTPLQSLSSVTSGPITVNQPLPDGVATGVTSSVTFTQGLHVEHAEVNFQSNIASGGDLQITLISPNGTRSVLAAERVNDTTNGLAGGTPIADYTAGWTFTTDEDWGENSAGTWTLQVADDNANGIVGNFGSWTLTLLGTQDYAPIARNTSLSTQENTAGSINLLSNTYDTDGTYTIASGSLKIASQPADGTVTVNPQTGQVTYTPNPNFYGTDSFTYTVTDTNGVASRAATVTVTVSPVLAVPVANNVTTSTSFETPVAIPVLTDVTPGTGTLVPSSVTVVTKPNFGTASVNQSTGTITYTPGPNFTISDSFTYDVTDSNGKTTNVATVTIDLAQPAPVANNVVAPPADLNVTQQINVLANVIGGANPATVTIVTGPQNGIAVVDAVTGLITYTPAANFFGSDSFTFDVKNFQGASSNLATVSVSVLDLGAPVALDHEFVLLPGQTVINGFRALDNPTNSGTLTSKLVTQATYGTVTLNSDGTFTYLPYGNSPGLDTFTYQVNNGMADSNVATVRLVSQNFHYVEKLYQQLLNRGASDSDILGFTAALNAGVSRAQIAAIFLNSNEYLANFVNASYQKLLHRSVDPVGLAYWISEMQAGLPPEVFLAAVAASPEYIGLHGGTTVGQIEGFYQDFLNRGASLADIDYWVGLTNSGTPPAAIVLGFDTSPEYRGDLVSGYYVTYLGNAPDPNSVAQYVASLGAGFSRTTVQLMILSSQQYYTS